MMQFEDFTEEMRNAIIEAAKQSLLKIGVTANIGLELSSGRTEKATLTTEAFNTTPVIYKRVNISGNAELEPVEGHEGVYDLNFYLSYWFETFSGGHNGTSLGTLKFRVFDSGYDKVRFIGFLI